MKRDGMDFWLTWCAPFQCKRPELEKRQRHAQGVWLLYYRAICFVPANVCDHRAITVVARSILSRFLKITKERRYPFLFLSHHSRITFNFTPCLCTGWNLTTIAMIDMKIFYTRSRIREYFDIQVYIKCAVRNL